MTPRTQNVMKTIMQKLAAAGEQAPQPPVPAPAEVPPAEEPSASAAPSPEERAAAEQLGMAEETPEVQLVDMLIAAYSAEKVSEYQYEQAINTCLGKARNYFLSEATEHRAEEHDHADMLAARIDELGGEIPFTLEELAAANPAGSPQRVEGNRDTAVLTQQIIEAEQAAVEIYSQIEQMTRDTDPVTNDMIIGILATEQKHVVDMTKIAMTIGM